MADPLKEIERGLKASRERESQDIEIKFFQKELEAARKRERKWRHDATRVIDIYEAKKADDNAFNILYANTEVLLPVLFSGSPRPMVERAFQDDDPVAKAGCEVIERTLKFLIRQRGTYTPFTSLMSKAVLGALLPGRGLTQFEYDATIESRPSTVGSYGTDEEAEKGDKSEGNDQTLREAALTETGEEAVPVPKAGNGEGTYDKVNYESVCGCNWEYDKVLTGFAYEWNDVPWVAFEYFMDREDLKVNFPGKNESGKPLYECIPVEKPARRDEETGRAKREDSEDENLGTVPGARVFGIWWKTKRQVLFYAPSYPDVWLKKIDDPLGLSSFYNFPAPLTLFVKYRPQVPTVLYKLYEQQAKELNRLSKRINRLCEALKARGFYDGTLTGADLKTLLASEDNTLLPIKNVQQLSDKPNLANYIWMVPLEAVIQALRECITAREACKQTIYEINGIADIMRAQSGPYDTATATNLKNKWGTLRISKGQGRVQNYIRDCLQIVAEIACKHFDMKTFQAMTNLDYSTQQDREQAQQQLMMVQQQYQQMVLAAQQQPMGMPPGQPPQQPQQPQPTPDMQKAMQQAQMVLTKPQWEPVLDLLRNDLLRNFRIDIETDSTLATETQATQEEINETMQALSQMYQSFLPAVQQGALTMPALKQILITVTRRMPFGKQIEDQIQQMPDQLPQQPDPKLDAIKAKAQADIQMSNIKLQQSQRDDQRQQQEHQFALAKAQREEEAAQAEHQTNMAEMQSRMQQAAEDLALKREQAAVERQKMALELQSAAAERDMKQQMAAKTRAEAVVSKREAAKPPTEDPAILVTRILQEHFSKPRKLKINRDMLGKISDVDLH